MLTEKQREYLANCNHRWNIKTGATGSGKSYLDVAVTIPKRIMATKGDGLIVILGNTRDTVKRNILEPMQDLWGLELVSNIRSDNKARIFGKWCYVLGADNKRRVDRIQGATIEYAYGDEITTWEESVFTMLKSRLRCENSCFDGTCNPDSPTHWVRRFLDSDADIYHQQYEIDDGALPEHIVAELKREYAGTVWYDRYILGKWVKAEGLVYQRYQEVMEPRYTGEVTEHAVSIDYGTQNAFHALLWANDGQTWHCVDEYRYSGREQGHQKTDSEYGEDMERFCPREATVIIDPSAASFIAEMRSRGFSVLGADNDVLDGIRHVSTCMATGRIRIGENCVGLIEELAGYVWDDKNPDKPTKENDHGCDALRYMVETLDVWDGREAYEPGVIFR